MNSSKINHATVEGHPTEVTLVIAWGEWIHAEELQTSQLRVLATITNTTVDSKPAQIVKANGSHIFLTWAVEFPTHGNQSLTVHITYDNDHEYVTGTDGKRHRKRRESGRSYQYPIQVLEEKEKPKIVKPEEEKEPE